jgi:hypothetical protein
LGATGLPLFSLKGCNKSAQGNALGEEALWRLIALKGRNKNLPRFCIALSGLAASTTSLPQGVALGCFVAAFQAKERLRRNQFNRRT